MDTIKRIIFNIKEYFFHVKGKALDFLEKKKDSVSNKNTKQKGDNYDHSGIKEQRVMVSKKVGRKVLKKKISFIVICIVVSLIVIYLCFAATIIRFIPTTNGMGPVLIKNSTYVGNILPKGAQVIIDTKSENDDGIIDHLKQTVIPTKNIAKVEIVAGPYGKLSYSDNIVFVDGNSTDVSIDEGLTDSKYLQNQYVAKCLEGDCSNEKGLIFKGKQLVGIPIK